MAAPGGCAGPGIRALLDLIGEHPQALSYDWRVRFGLPLEAIFDGRMTYAEAWRLTTELAADPTSRVAAAINGWDHPFSQEAAILADLFDVTVAANTEPKRRNQTRPYPRPWPSDQGQRSKPATVDQSTVRAALAARGH
ncbi:MAG: hypothetical protein GEU83_11840 [Pseudonocardiaceae bacterium]|nr:hypothetical protein [Pseudonocardiaceae bacterium]